MSVAHAIRPIRLRGTWPAIQREQIQAGHSLNSHAVTSSDTSSGEKFILKQSEATLVFISQTLCSLGHSCRRAPIAEHSDECAKVLDSVL